MCEGGAVDDLQANQMRAEPEVLSRERAVWRVGGGASLGGGAQGGGHALRAGCGAATCSDGEIRARRSRGLVPRAGSSQVEPSPPTTSNFQQMFVTKQAALPLPLPLPLSPQP